MPLHKPQAQNGEQQLMHVVLVLLGSVVSILYMLDRMGVDLGGMNPFHWRRRRAWAKKYGGDPIYSIEDPIQVAVLLVVGTAKLDGDMSTEQKTQLLEMLESVFSINAKAASDLVGSAQHLLAAPQVIDSQLNNLARKNRHLFSSKQGERIVEMMIYVTKVAGNLSAKQAEYIAKVRSIYVTDLT